MKSLKHWKLEVYNSVVVTTSRPKIMCRADAAIGRRL